MNFIPVSFDQIEQKKESDNPATMVFVDQSSLKEVHVPFECEETVKELCERANTATTISGRLYMKTSIGNDITEALDYVVDSGNGQLLSIISPTKRVRYTITRIEEEGL